MTKVALVIPGSLETPTGGYIYDRRVAELAAAEGVELSVISLPGDYPEPRPSDLANGHLLLKATSPETILLIDGLAYGVFPQAYALSIGRKIVALVHHPLGHETGLSEGRRRGLLASETGALAVADHVIATSPATARALVGEFNLRPEAITIAEPGTDPAPRSTGSGGKSVQILAVGAVTPRKNYDGLVAVLATLAHLDWHLTIVGALDRHEGHVAELREVIADNELASRVTLAGAVSPEALNEAYAKADLFVIASHYEGYGMVAGEAMVRGLPIVTTTGGALGDTIPDEAAMKVPPDDVQALGGSLAIALSDRKWRADLAAASFAAGARLPRWEQTAKTIFDAIKGLS